MSRIGLIAIGAAATAFSGVQDGRAQPASPPPQSVQVESGGRLYEHWCGGCHGPKGQATQALDHRYKGAEPALLIERADLPPELIKFVVRNGISFMPFFRKTEITDQELAALSAYLSTPPARRPKIGRQQ